MGARTRVHDLAVEYGVTSAWVLARFKELGWFVKSASSSVSPEAERRFRDELGERLEAGQSPVKVAAASAGRPRPQSRLRPPVSRAPRRTSWDDSPFPPEAVAIWRRHGLGDHDAALATFLLEHGLLPEDLGLMLRGRAAVRRLREGEASWTVLAKEMLEVRASVPAVPQELPSTKVVRRRIGG